MHVLVMSEGWEGALACIQSFGRRGHKVSVLYASDFISAHAFSQYVQNRIQFYDPTATRAAHAAKLVGLLHAEAVDLVIPVSDEDTHILALCKTLEPTLRSIICPPLEHIELARDRQKTEAFCRENGIRIPDSIQATSPQALREAALALGYPVLVKRSYSAASNGVTIAHGEHDLAAMDEFFQAGHPLQVQKFIEGEFVGATGFGWQGQLKGSTFSFHTPLQYSRRGGLPYAFVEPGDAATDILARIVQLLNWSGGIDIDLIKDASGALYLLEINPRLAGMSVFPFKLGIDLPRLYEAALDESFDQLPAAPPVSDTRMFISYPDEVVFISKNPTVRFPEATAMRLKHECLDSLFLDDTGLTQHQFMQFMKNAWFTPRET